MSTEVSEVRKYVVVKDAGDDWQKFWAKDPKETGVVLLESAAHTFTGTVAMCEESYDDLNSAEAMAAKLRTLQPTCSYAICPLVNTGFVLDVRSYNYGNRRLKPDSPFGVR